MPNRLFSAVFGIAIAVVALAGCSAAVGGPTATPTAAETPFAPTPTFSPSPTPKISASPTPTEGKPAHSNEPRVWEDVAAQIDEIAGLKKPVAVKVRPVSQKGLLEQALALAFPQKAKGEEEVLKAFGFLPPQANLQEIRRRLVSAYLPLALYDPDADAILLSGRSRGGESTLALAYAEAYADAVAWHLTAHPPPCKDDDCALAAEAARVGYASYIAERWFSEYAAAERYARAAQVSSTPQPSPDVPFALARDWDFPQEYGFTFMLGLSRRGPKALTDALKSPPVSSEQVMHPARYPSDEPIPVALPSAQALASALGKGWQEVGRGVLGEWHTYLLLTAALPEESRLLPHTASAAAEGWGGDAYSVLSNGRSRALLVDWRWDSNADTNEFVRAFVRFARGRYGPLHGRACCALFWEGNGRAGVLRYSGRERRAVWAEAPTREQAESLLKLADAPHP